MHIKQALLHNTVWKMITLLFTFVNNIIIVRLLGAETSGIFFYDLAILAFIAAILRLGLENGLVYVVSKNPQQMRPAVIFLIPVVFLQAMISFLLLKYFINPGSSVNIFLAVLYIMSNILVMYVNAFYQVKKRFISLNLSSAVFVLLQTILILFFYSVRKNDPGYGYLNVSDTVLMIISGCSLLNIAWLSVYFYFFEKDDFSVKEISPKPAKHLIAFSLLNFASGILFFLIMRADLYFVQHNSDPLILSNYIQSAKIGQIVLIIPGQISGVIFPYAVNASGQFEKRISFFARMSTLIFFIGYILFIFTGRLFIRMIFGDDFHYMYSGLVCSLPGVYFLTVNLIIISYFEGKNMQKIILLSNLVTLFIILAADYFFVPQFGYIAAALIFSFGNLAGMIITSYRFIKISRLSATSLFFFNRNDLHLKKQR